MPRTPTPQAEEEKIVRCSLCGELDYIEELQPYNDDHPDLVACKYCRQLVYKCAECGSFSVTKFNVHIDGKDMVLCHNCIADRFTQCSICSTMVPKDDIKQLGNREVCAKCHKRHAYTCPDCGKEVLRDETNRVRRLIREEGEDRALRLRTRSSLRWDNEYRVCHSCLSEHYSTCRGCHTTMHNDDMIEDELAAPHDDGNRPEFQRTLRGIASREDDVRERGRYEYETPRRGPRYCPACFYNATGIRNYNFVPKFKKYMMSHEQDAPGTIFVGLEIEVEDRNRRSRETHADIAHKIMAELPFTYCMHDGSLECGFEIATMPLSWNWLRNNEAKLKPIFDLRNDGFRSYDTTSCGMHVHLSKDSFKNLHLYKFLRFFYDNPQFIMFVSQRSRVSKLQRWASLESKESLKFKARQKRQKEHKYTAINLMHKDSVEIRVFRGTLNPISFFKNVEFCKAVMDFTRSHGLKDITVESFVHFLEESHHLYPRLFSFFRDHKFFLGEEMINRYSTKMKAKDLKDMPDLNPNGDLEVPMIPTQIGYIEVGAEAPSEEH